MLQVDSIDVGYGDVQVLKHVSLGVQAKELVAVIGANGAGKTTLINTISGILKPHKGTVTFTASVSAAVPPTRSWPPASSRCRRVGCFSQR